MSRRLVPIEIRRAEPGETACPLCPRPVERWQRLALVQLGELGHAWIHIRHLAEPLPAPSAAAAERQEVS
jgi:hypothetical protein